MENKAANFDRCYGFTHVIRKGDTIYKLSKQYNVKVSALILANPFVNIYNLQVGDEICIPRIRPVVIPVTPYPQSPYPRPGVIQPRNPEEENGGRMAGETENSEDVRNARTERETENIQTERETEQEMEPSELPCEKEEEPLMQEEKDSAPAKRARDLAETAGDSVETASCPCEEERIRAMTVDALLEEWDLSYASLASCLEVLKKM